ncbi:MAG: hypothetical protein WBH45_18605, partial [Acidobacteriaceae bacterium]
MKRDPYRSFVIVAMSSPRPQGGWNSEVYLEKHGGDGVTPIELPPEPGQPATFDSEEDGLNAGIAQGRR